MKRSLTVLMICILCIMPISMVANDLVETAEENNIVEATNTSKDYEYDAGLEAIWEAKADTYKEWSSFLNIMLFLVAILLVLKDSAADAGLRKLDAEEREIQKEKNTNKFIKEIGVVIGIAISLNILLIILNLLEII